MNFRIGLLAEHRGKGIGTEATILALDHAFTMLELHRVSLEVLTFNPRAQRSYEKQASPSRADCARCCTGTGSGSMPS